MRRLWLTIPLFLLLGVVINTLVAWAFVIRTFDVANVWQRALAPAELERVASRCADGAIVSSGETYQAAGVDWHQLRAGSGPTWNIVETSAGWPLRSLTGSWRRAQFQNGVRVSSGLWRVDIPRTGYRDLPYQPYWLGFTSNALLYASAAWLLALGPWRLRRHLRKQRGQCLACGYPIGVSPVCTECGRAVRCNAQPVTGETPVPRA